MILHKLSKPGWTKECNTDEELRQELYTNICYSCRLGSTYGETVIWKPVNENSSIPDLLLTACGCEYMFTMEKTE